MAYLIERAVANGYPGSLSQRHADQESQDIRAKVQRLLKVGCTVNKFTVLTLFSLASAMTTTVCGVRNAGTRLCIKSKSRSAIQELSFTSPHGNPKSIFGDLMLEL